MRWCVHRMTIADKRLATHTCLAEQRDYLTRAHAQVSTTLPDLPEFMASKPSANCV